MKFIKDWLQHCKQWVSSWRLRIVWRSILYFSGSCTVLCASLYRCSWRQDSRLVPGLIQYCCLCFPVKMIFNKVVFDCINSLTHRLRKESKSCSIYCSYNKKASTVIFYSVKIKFKSLVFEETQVCVLHTTKFLWEAQGWDSSGTKDTFRCLSKDLHA